MLCPVGAVLSFFGIFKEPKGFAIAGLIIGLVGSIGFIIVFFVFGAVLITLVAMSFGLGKYAEVGTDTLAIHTAVTKYVSTNGALPSTLHGLPGVTADQATDPWGNAYVFTPDPANNSYTIISLGPDGKMDTADDVTITHSTSR